MAHSDDERSALGVRLADARKLAAYTLESASVELTQRGYPIGKAAVGAWETGRNVPDALWLARLAKLYQTSADGLLGVRVVLLSAALALTGCASVDQLREQARYQPDYAVCEKMITGMGSVRGVAAEEAQRRGLDCGQHAGPILANQQQQNQLGVQLLQMAQPQPVLVPAPVLAPSVICTSRPGPGGTSSTVCQ